MREPRASSSGLSLAAALSAAVATYSVSRVATIGMFPAHDIYAYSYPKMLYAVESLAAGGRGLFWNPFQNCGQPFYALSQTGLLYPPHWLFLVLEPGLALSAVVALNHVIAGVGIYLLARQLGAGPAAAACGMLALQLGTSLRAFSTLATPHLSAYVWLPAALLATERLLAAPGAARAVLLALVLAVQWLPGSPQVWFLTLQLIGLRVAWALVTAPPAGRVRTLSWVAIGLALVPALAGIQMLPEAEAVRVSLRSGALQAREADPLGFLSRADVDQELALRGMNHRAVVPALVPIVLVASVAGGLGGGIFYAVAGLLYGVLAFGPATPLFSWYLALPGAALFRFASRLLWVTGFCFALLTALGVEALTRARAGRMARLGPLVVLGALGLGLAATERLVPGGLYWTERAVVAVAAGAAVMAAQAPALRARTEYVVLAVVGFALVAISGGSSRFLLAEPPPYGARRALVEEVRRLVSAQERVYVVNRLGWYRDYSLIPKTPSLVRLRSSVDYEPLLSARYARFAVRMRTGRDMTNRNEAIYMPELGPQHSRRLLDLTATRYVLVDRREASVLEKLPTLVSRFTLDDTLVLENPSALPRAFWVPRVEVVPEASAMLERMARGADDLRHVAFVESIPASGFTGPASGARGAGVRFVRDDPEHVELTVEAPARGFLVLSDQYDTGWSAAVDGKPTPVLRANYAFRAVEVPGGSSTVAFRYRPPGLVIGALLTATGLLVAAGLVVREGRRAHAPSPGDGAPASSRALA